MNVGAAAGRAGETEAETCGQRAVGRGDRLLRDHALIGGAVEAVREAQQAVLSDFQVVEDRRAVAARHRALVGDLHHRRVEHRIGGWNGGIVQNLCRIHRVVDRRRTDIRGSGRVRVVVQVSRLTGVLYSKPRIGHAGAGCEPGRGNRRHGNGSG